jgi:very-short-patch-repair endonuclease
MAAQLGDRRRVERLIDRADARGILKPDTLRAAVDAAGGQHGVPLLRAVLDRAEFVLTDSELERMFLPIARRAGLPKPLTRQVVNGYRVDFYWPDLGLVVEVDGHRYHRTPTQQAEDLRRDQAHLAAGLRCGRFSYIQVAEDEEVEPVLARLSR